MNNTPIIIEQTYHAPIQHVWIAISNKTEMKKWYFDLPEFKAEVGFEFQFWGGTEDKQYLHLCKITEVIPGKKLVHTWRYDGYEGISYLSFELFPEGENTRLKLTHSGLESFPKNNPDLAKENFVKGWTAILGDSLEDYLKTSV